MGPRPVVQVERKIEPIVIKKKEEKAKRMIKKDKDKIRKEREEQPGSIFTEIDLREDSVYATGEYDQEYADGSVEIR